ncbi:hypothetical protein LINPERHAP1_LOCUS4326 [Linum perenne]
MAFSQSLLCDIFCCQTNSAATPTSQTMLSGNRWFLQRSHVFVGRSFTGSWQLATTFRERASLLSTGVCSVILISRLSITFSSAASMPMRFGFSSVPNFPSLALFTLPLKPSSKGGKD